MQLFEQNFAQLAFFLYFCRLKTMQHIRYISSVVLFLLISLCLSAQNATSSPSSRFGYGELNDNIPVPFRSMGGVSVGLRRNNAINMAQPASYTACDTMTFMFDVAASAIWTQYKDMNGSRNRPNGNLEYVTLQIPLWKQHIAFAAGVMPYSSVGYDFAVAGSEGGHDFTLKYMGEGGIAQVCAGLSFNILNWVALGANFYYMFGDVTNGTELVFDESGISGSLMYRNMEVRNFRMRYGLQAFHTFAKDHEVVLGAVMEHRQRMNGEYVQYELYTLDSVIVESSGFQVPLYYSVGASYRYKDRLTVAFDFARTEWSKAKYFGQKGQFKDRSRYALGVEYRHNPMSRNYGERMFWRTGVSMTDSYVRATNSKDWSVSLGMGFPLRTTATILNFAVEYTRRNPLQGMKENNLKFTLGVGVNETWFFKRKL